MPEKPWNWDDLDTYEKREWCRENGYVVCDDFCMAPESPATPEEYIAAYTHWREHPLYYGCSHGGR